jgi:hypothetical protein
MSRTEVMEKARDLIAPVLGSEKSGRLIDTVYAMEAVTNIRALQPLLKRVSRA